MSVLLKPSNTQLIKLGSIAVHAEELLDMQASGDARAAQFDIEAIRGLLADAEVRAILDDPSSQVFLPVKRSA